MYKQGETEDTQEPRRPSEIDKHVDTFLATVCDKSRRYILQLLAQPDGQSPDSLPEHRSGEIARLLGLSAATTSEHLKQLSNLGLVSSRREGTSVYYRLRNHKLVHAFHDLLLALNQDYQLRQGSSESK